MTFLTTRNTYILPIVLTFFFISCPIPNPPVSKEEALAAAKKNRNIDCGPQLCSYRSFSGQQGLWSADPELRCFIYEPGGRKRNGKQICRRAARRFGQAGSR